MNNTAPIHYAETSHSHGDTEVGVTTSLMPPLHRSVSSGGVVTRHTRLLGSKAQALTHDKGIMAITYEMYQEASMLLHMSPISKSHHTFFPLSHNLSLNDHTYFQLSKLKNFQLSSLL